MLTDITQGSMAEWHDVLAKIIGTSIKNPTRDSNPESPPPEGGALSILPVGLAVIPNVVQAWSNDFLVIVGLF